MAPTRTPHHLWARNEARYSCYGVAVITQSTCAAWHGFGYPADDGRRWYAMDCKRASWQTPFVPANRISALEDKGLLLIHAVKVSPARAHRCSQLASGKDRFAIATESRVPHPLHSAL